MNPVRCPDPGTIVTYYNSDTNRTFDVYIINGGKFSNYWYWRKILDSGKLGKIESGYGNFHESPNKYEITIIAKRV